MNYIVNRDKTGFKCPTYDVCLTEGRELLRVEYSELSGEHQIKLIRADLITNKESLEGKVEDIIIWVKSYQPVIPFEDGLRKTLYRLLGTNVKK